MPGRKELGTGEINYPKIAEAFYQMGYRVPVAMEAYASDDPENAIEAFQKAFTIADAR